MDNKNGLLAGKKGLIMGVANNRSIAWESQKQLLTREQSSPLRIKEMPLKKFEPLAFSWQQYFSKL